MKLPFSKSKSSSTTPDTGLTADTSKVPPATANSVSSSDLDEKKELEDERTNTLARVASAASNASKFQTTGLKEALALDKPTDELEYPSGPKLAIITAALCFSVFCMALVCET